MLCFNTNAYIIHHIYQPEAIPNQSDMLCFNTSLYYPSYLGANAMLILSTSIIPRSQCYVSIQVLLCFNTSLYYPSYLGANAMFQYNSVILSIIFRG